MVFPYMEHDLDGLLQNPQVKFSIEQVKSYMQQLLKGIEHLHLNNILHRDIKSMGGSRFKFILYLTSLFFFKVQIS